MTNAIKTRDVDAGYWRRVIPNDAELQGMLTRTGATMPLGSKPSKPYEFDGSLLMLLASILGAE